MKKNVASQSVGVQMITTADGTNFTGAVSVLVTKDNGAQTAGAGATPAHKGNGYHSYTPTQTETNANHIAFTFTGTGAITSTVQLYTTYPQSADNNTILTTLPTQTYLDGRTLASAAYFDPTTDTVANVTTTANLTTNNDKTGYSISGTKTTLDSLNDISATAIVSGGAINTLAGAVQNVDLVDVCTTNTDMRGTNNALLATNYTAPDNTSISSILADTNELQLNQGNWITATGFATVNPDNAGIATAVTNINTALTNINNVSSQISALNNISVNDVLSTQMTESYAANGVAPTLAQSLFLTMQNLQNFSYAGTTQTVKGIDGATTIATYTLDDAVNPTSKTRAT